MPALPVILGVHLLTSVASAIAAFVLTSIPNALRPRVLVFSVTSNINFLAASVLAVVWSPSSATTMLIAFVMLLIAIFSIRYHAAQFYEWRDHIQQDSFFMTSGNAVIASLAIYHLVRQCGRSDALANLLFTTIFLSLVMLTAVLYATIRLKNTLFFPTSLTLLAIVLLAIAEAIGDPEPRHTAAVFVVGAAVPAVVTILHGAFGVPKLNDMQQNGTYGREKQLIFIDLQCGIFHCVAALAVSMAVYLARRESDSDVSKWYTALLLVSAAVLPLAVVAAAWLGFKK